MVSKKNQQKKKKDPKRRNIDRQVHAWYSCEKWNREEEKGEYKEERGECKWEERATKIINKKVGEDFIPIIQKIFSFVN